MKHDLETYLNDHLAGSAGGLILAKKLAETATDNAQKLFFHDLTDKIEEDRAILTTLIQQGGFSIGTIRHAVGSAMARASVWRMDMNGMDLGELGRFEMIELLALGIHGKSLLWKTLREINGTMPAWAAHDFGELERQAMEQRASIEIYRAGEALQVFAKCTDQALSH
ncbi:MAG: hypothetical protein ABJQ29_01320 [Luteolibacter sp.]